MNIGKWEKYREYLPISRFFCYNKRKFQVVVSMAICLWEVDCTFCPDSHTRSHIDLPSLVITDFFDDRKSETWSCMVFTGSWAIPSIESFPYFLESSFIYTYSCIFYCYRLRILIDAHRYWSYFCIENGIFEDVSDRFLKEWFFCKNFEIPLVRILYFHSFLIGNGWIIRDYLFTKTWKRNTDLSIFFGFLF